jgi:hypothetical protein
MLYGPARRSDCRPGARHAALEGLEQRFVGLRVVERLAGRVEHRHAAFGEEEAHRALAAVELVGDEGPDRTFSSGVSCASGSPAGCGRADVRCAKRRERSRCGPKFTMSRPRHDRRRARRADIAPSRSGPAEKTPPTRWSAISVVVMSRTAAISPESTSFSIDRPPVPVAWNTRGRTVLETAHRHEPVHQRRRHPEHRQADRGSIVVVRPLGGRSSRRWRGRHCRALAARCG